MSASLSDLALSDLTIVEHSDSVATRYCGRLFALHGATVMQVGAPLTEVGYGGTAGEAYAAWLDGGKQRAIDLEAALAGKVDLIIAGLDAATIAKVDAALERRALAGTVRVGLSWFAPDGPYADWTGSDALIQAMSGVAHPTGALDGAPMLPRGHAPQVVGGATAFIAALAAVIGRDAGWRGRRIDLDILEANMCFTETTVATEAMSGDYTPRQGINRFKAVYPGGIYRTADGWIGVTTVTPDQWSELCRMIGLPLLADGPLRLAVNRLARVGELEPQLVRAFSARTSDAWLVEGQRRRIPLAPVPDLAQLPRLPHWKERGSFAPVPGYATATAPTVPFRREARPPVAAGDMPVRQGVTRPLQGLRVLDLSMGWSGPLAARHLADLGAEVIKVESCIHLDWWRGFYADISIEPPPYETRPNFLMVNRNKLGTTLDLKSAAGRDLVFRLAAISDVLIENYAPGALDKLGLGAAKMMAVKPDLVHLSMGAFGAMGPWRGFRGYGSTVEQASGLPFVNGEPDDPPTMQHAAYGDPVAGLFGAIACLIGVYDRAKHHRGSVIDLGQVECLFQLGADAIIAQSLQRDRLAREGSRHPLAALRCVAATNADGKWIAVTAGTAAQAMALASAIGRPDLAVASEAKKHEAALEEALRLWCAGRDRAEAVATLQAAGVSAGPVHAGIDLLDDPQLRQSGFWRTADRLHAGRHITPLAPYRFDGERPPLVNPTPTLGQHNGEVLGGRLGLSPVELDRLTREGVIGTRANAR